MIKQRQKTCECKEEGELDPFLGVIVNFDLVLCAACPVGYFKSLSGSVPCSVCPANSRTSQEGSSMCECRSSFYRAANDANSSACTSRFCVLMPGFLGGGQGASADSFSQAERSGMFTQ